MTNTEFSKIYEGLANTWGDEFTPEVSKQLWDDVNAMDSQTFKSVVDDLLSTRRRAPSYYQLKAILSGMSGKAKRERDKTRSDRIECGTCYGQGIVFAKLPEHVFALADYAFRCDSCRVADIQGIAKSIQSWSGRQDRGWIKTKIPPSKGRKGVLSRFK